MSIPHFPSIRQVHSTICWAACIEMVTRFLKPQHTFDDIDPADMPLQKRVLKEYYTMTAGLSDDESNMLDSFCRIGDGFPTLRPERKYYQEILKSVFNIRSKQKIQNNIPSFTVMQRHTDAGKPLILGMKYPGIESGNHAVVVVNCKREEIRIVHVVDPFANHTSDAICETGEGIDAYLSYSFLYNLNRDDPSSVSVVSDFEDLASPVMLKASSSGNGSEISGLQSRGGVEEIRDMVMGLFLNESIFNVKLENLKMREAVITSGYQTLRQFLDGKAAAELKLIKVLTSRKDSLEVMISETKSDSDQTVYEFVGIRESYFTDEHIASVKLKFKEKSVSRAVNHFEPNYTLLHLQPGDLMFMVFTEGEEKCYVSLSQRRSIGLHYREAYSFQELQSIITKVFPRYAEYEPRK